MADCRSLRLINKVLDAVSLGDYGDASFGNREAAASIQTMVVANLDAGGNVHALVDDRAANLGIAADVDALEQNGILDLRRSC